MARGEVIIALRDGAVPGTRVRRGGKICFGMGHGIGAATGFASPSEQFSNLRKSKVTIMKMKWAGVIPAMTTEFKADYSVDHAAVGKHARWLIDNGCTGIVALGSLGESATLKFDEKVAVLKTLVDTLGKKAPVVAGIASLSTMEAVELAKAAEGV